MLGPLCVSKDYWRHSRVNILMATKFLPKLEDTFTDFCFILGSAENGKVHELCSKIPMEYCTITTVISSTTKALFPLLHFQTYNQQLCINCRKVDSTVSTC